MLLQFHSLILSYKSFFHLTIHCICILIFRTNGVSKKFDFQPHNKKLKISFYPMTKNSNPRLISSFKSFSEYASISIILVGIVVIIGWILNIQSLKRISPGFASMKPNTAISFILIGIALYLLQDKRANSRTIYIAKGCAIFVAIIGLLTLIEHTFIWNIGIDQLLFKDSFPDKVSSFPGRMSPTTALNFLLIGIAIFLLDLDIETRSGFRPAQLLAIFSSIISMFAFLGYLYNVESLYIIVAYRSMALHTTITFLVVYTAILSARPDRGLMKVLTSKHAGGLLARRMFFLAIIIPPFLGWLRLFGQRAGFYDTECGLAIVIMSTMIIFAVMILRSARSLDKKDIEREQTKELLMKSNKILNEAQEIAHIGSWEWDIVKNELYWSDENYRIFGLLQQEFGATYEAFFNCVHPDDREFVKRSVNEALYDKKPYDIDHRILLRNGDIRTVHERAEVDYNEHGKAVRMVGTVQDITERKRAQEEADLLQAVTMAIVKAKDLSTALNAVLQMVSETTGWVYGEVWMLCSDCKKIKCRHAWHSNIEKFEDFSKKSKEFLFPIGTGFPGRIWSSKKPEWIPDVTVDGNFPRANITKEAGFKATVGIPVIINDEVIAVLNFFVRERRKEDERLIRLITTIATQLGSVIQRRLAEEALSESEERLRSILDNATSVIYLKNLKGQYTFINRQFINLFNIKSDELRNKTDYDLFSGEIANTLRANDQKVIEAKAPMEFDEVIPLKDGLRTYFSVKFPLFDSTGAVYAVCGISTDITERKHTELLLKMYANQQSSIAELGKSALMGIDISILMDVAVNIIAKSLNVEYCKILELLPDGNSLLLKSGVGWKDGLVGHATVGAGTNSQAGYTLLSHAPVIVEDLRAETCFSGHPLLHEHGVISGISVIINGKNRPYGVLGAHTTRKRIFSKEDIHFLQSIANILAMVIERTQGEEEKEKPREQLYHTQKLDSVGRVAGGIAHDFNNILTAIIGYANLLQMQLKEDDVSMDFIKKILISGERAANLARGLLVFSRKQPGNPEPVNLNEIIHVSEDILKRLIPENIMLKTILTDKDCIIKADRGQIEQVLMNFATNARDAMPNGGFLGIRADIVEIDDAFIKKHGFGKAGMYALVSVSDTGMGMDEKTRARIFEPFFTTKEEGKGTGLGLAIVYGIITQHNGYIDAESEPGKGTIFRIYLPTIQQETRKGKTETFVVSTGGTETILVAEDEELVRMVIKITLEKHGYRVIEAVDGENAIIKFIENKDKIQLLLFDVLMPYMNGKEAYDEIKKSKPDIKVLFKSGYSAEIIQNQDIIEKGIKLIPKPILPTVLLRGVRETLDK